MVKHTDVLPTVLAALGIFIPPGLSGRNLLDRSLDTEISGLSPVYAETWAPRLQYGWSQLHSLRDRSYLYVQAPHPELYDLSEDPGEVVNIYGTSPDRQNYFESVLDSIESLDVGRTVSEQIEISREDRKALEKLGYVFDSTTSDSAAADPKDMILVQREILSGWKSLKKGNYREALTIFQNVMREDSTVPTVYLGLGMCCDGLGLYEEALPYLRKGIEIDPREERLYYAASNVLKKLERFPEAAEMLEALITVYPEDPVAWRIFAKALTRSGEDQRAYDAYRTSIRLDETDYRVFLDFGRFLLVRGKDAEAAQELSKAISISPACAPAHALLGASYARRGELEKARESFRSSVESDSTQATPWIDLGTVLRKLGDFDEAGNAYRRALEIDPTLEPVRKKLEDLEKERGEG